METVVNNPTAEDTTSGPLMFMVMIALAIGAILFFIYGMPALAGRRMEQGTVSMPSVSENTVPAIPENVDINVNTP